MSRTDYTDISWSRGWRSALARRGRFSLGGRSVRIVVKIGTSNLCGPDGRLDEAKVGGFAGQLVELYQAGHQLIVVSSGAVGAGMGAIGRRARTVQEKQALAAVGQAHLIHSWHQHLGPVIPAQILLTGYDLTVQDRRLNSARTLEQLVAWGILPIINENDSVADDEIRIGDNDTLAARVASLMRADLLVLLSDVDGLYTQDPNQHPQAEKIRQVSWVTTVHLQAAQGAGQFGTGGMTTKLQAAMICQDEGIPMVLANGQWPQILSHIVSGDAECGTWFLARRGEVVES